MTSNFRRVPVFALVFAVLAVAGACSNSRAVPEPPPAKAGLVDIGAGLSGPKGATATVFATGLKNVSALSQDSEGRVWAASAAFADNGTDAIYLLDGKATEPLEVVAGLHSPMGLLWIGDDLYVSSAEGITVFSGFDGAGFNTEQTVATFPGAGLLGGLALGTDGRIRLGISAPCDHCTPDSRWAAAVVSFLPDGNDARVEASGIRAPVGLAYVPGTADLLVTMNQRDDLGDATPGDYLALLVAGDTWGFPACFGQGGDSCVSVPPPVAELDKHAAVSGIVIVGASERHPATAYVAEWATGKILQVPLTKTATSYSGTPAPSIEGIQSPVPIIASSDGTLLVGDWVTGTVFRISLPE